MMSTVLTASSCRTVVTENNTAPPRQSMSPTSWFLPATRRATLNHNAAHMRLSHANNRLFCFRLYVITRSRGVVIVIYTGPNQASHAHQADGHANNVHHSVSNAQYQKREHQGDRYRYTVEELERIFCVLLGPNNFYSSNILQARHVAVSRQRYSLVACSIKNARLRQQRTSSGRRPSGLLLHDA